MLARAFDEPLAGTAPVAVRWAALEYRGAWPQNVERHPDPHVSAFAARATAAGWRFLLIRRPGRRVLAGPNRLLLADTAATEVRMLTVDAAAELDAVALPAPDEPLPGSPVADPPLLVCTHGRRDRCCALDGRALAAALVDAGEPNVWECSHLGGHRFAPTALVLPTGYVYGRLDPASAIAAGKAAALGEVEISLCRGRSTLSAAGQAAELAVRAVTGVRDVAALRVTEDAHGVLVSHVHDGRRWAVDVAPQDGTMPCSTSCGVAALPRVAMRATDVRPLPSEVIHK